MCSSGVCIYSMAFSKAETVQCILISGLHLVYFPVVYSCVQRVAGRGLAVSS